MSRMRRKFVSLSLVIAFTPWVYAATPYEEDTADFYVTGQSINAALKQANSVICAMKAMRPDALVNDGAYVATVYDSKCQTSNANATKDEASATATSSQSSSTASGSSGSQSDAQTSSSAIVKVIRASGSAPVKANVWFTETSQDQYDFDKKVYVHFEQSAGVSEDSPYGDFFLRWSSHADSTNDFFGTFGDIVGDMGDMPLGEGFLKADGNVIKFKEFSLNREGNISATFQSNGDVVGVYGEFAGFVDDNWQWHDVFAFYKFKMDKSEKVYCRNYLSALSLDFGGGGGGAGYDDGSSGGGDGGAGAGRAWSTGAKMKMD